MANEAEVKLFTTRFSPFGQRVAIALTEKNISFEVTIVDLANKPKELLEANPIHKKIPVIIHNGKPVAESSVILEYLEESFPERVPLMPKDAFEKSKARFWIDYVYKAFSVSWGVFRTKPGTPERQAVCAEVVNGLKTIDAGMASLSKDGPFFAGDQFGLIDVVLAPLCAALPLLQEPSVGGLVVPGPDELPRLHKWLETVKLHPSVSSILPPFEETLAYFKVILQRRAAAAAAAAPQK